MAGLRVSGKKHYLTGIDWIVHGFDYMNKRASAAGNMFQIVMELDGVPPEEEVRCSLERFSRKLPVLSGRTRRAYNLAPYWAMPSKKHRSALPFNVYHVQKGKDACAILESAANRPFRGKREHLAFHLICAGDKSYVAVTFDHRLFDAHGAEAFLRMFQQEWDQEEGCTWEFSPSEPAHLNQWRRKFAAGKRVNRAFLRLAENGRPRVLPLIPGLCGQGFKFKVVSFSEEQSRRILERADDEAGYLMVMPYTMALTVQILDGIFVSRGIDTGDYIVPVTIDTRPRGKLAQDMLFNHVSFFLFRIQAREAGEFSILLESIKEQMYDQVKAGLARDIWEASFLIRIVPLPILSRLMRTYFKGEVASFCFAFVGETGHTPSRFMGKRIERSYHMTRVPIPPGLGVLFQQWRGRLHAYLSYAQGLITEDEVNTIVNTLRERLGASS
jgi:hypothetical protein